MTNFQNRQSEDFKDNELKEQIDFVTGQKIIWDTGTHIELGHFVSYKFFSVHESLVNIAVAMPMNASRPVVTHIRQIHAYTDELHTKLVKAYQKKYAQFWT